MFDKELGRGQPIEGGLGHEVLRLRAEVARLTHWQRTVAAELGWCEAVDGSVRSAEFMAGVAKAHGESHRRLKEALAEAERLRGESDARGELGLLRLGRIAKALSILERWSDITVPMDWAALFRDAIAALKGKP